MIPYLIFDSPILHLYFRVLHVGRSMRLMCHLSTLSRPRRNSHTLLTHVEAARRTASVLF